MKKRVFFYYGVSNDQDQPVDLEQVDCLLSQRNPNNPTVDLGEFDFTFEDVETGTEVSFKLKDVTNITFAHKPFWEN